MSNQPKSKTAIRQLIEKIDDCITWRTPIRELGYDIENEARIEMLEFILDQAKELERVNEQEIKEAHFQGQRLCPITPKKISAEEYFNKTFEKP